MRKNACTQLQDAAIIGRGTLWLAAGDAFEHLRKCIAKVHGDDRWWCFVCSQAVIVCCRGDAQAKQILVAVDGFDHRGAEEQKHHVLLWIAAWVEKIQPSVGCNGPIEMFAASVDTGKRLFMEEAC